MRKNYYEDLAADYSKPGAVNPETQKKMIDMGEEFVRRKLPELPEVGDNYSWVQIERENMEWWPTHCEALRQSRADILTGEYRGDLVVAWMGNRIKNNIDRGAVD